MNAGIIIVSIGSGDPDLLNIRTVRVLRESVSLVLRTGRHPLVSWLRENGIPFATLDSLYDESEDFDQLNRMIAHRLFTLSEKQEIVYAVPDALTDRSVHALFSLKPDHCSVSVIPGVSAYDRFVSGSLPFLSESAVTVVPASDLSEGFHFDPNRSLLIAELDNPIQAGQVKLFLSEMLEDEHRVLLLREDAEPTEIPLWQLDRQPGTDHRTAVLVPGTGYTERSRFVMNDLTALMDRLRSDSGCPWDRIQTHESLRPYLIEEAWECVASIDQQDTDHLGEELGDLLFQVVFHASIGKSYDEFTFNDVVSSICRKMIRRHPHVFGDRDLKDPESVRAAWEQIKQEETGRRTAVSSLDDVSSGLPSLKYAAKIMKKLSATGAVRRDAEPVLEDMQRLLSGLSAVSGENTEHQAGRLLLLCAELCYILGCDGELVLRQAADQFKTRLKAAEKAIKNDGKSLEGLTFDELGVYLNHVEGEIE